MSDLNVQSEVLIVKLRKFVSYIYLSIAFPPSVLFLLLALLLVTCYIFQIYFLLWFPSLYILVLCFQILPLHLPGSSFRSQGWSSSPSIHLLKRLIGKACLSSLGSLLVLHLNLLMCSYYFLSARRLSPAVSLLHHWGSDLIVGGPTWLHFRERWERSGLYSCDLTEQQQADTRVLPSHQEGSFLQIFLTPSQPTRQGGLTQPKCSRSPRSLVGHTHTITLTYIQ